MSNSFEYQECLVQAGRVTFVNGAWQGTGNADTATLETCPFTWEYLHTTGREGWELITAIIQTTECESRQLLYLKRAPAPA